MSSTSILSTEVVNILDWLVMYHGMPEHIRSDNGPEFVANKVKHWITEQGYITPDAFATKDTQRIPT